jgi:hypothetical protein
MQKMILPGCIADFLRVNRFWGKMLPLKRTPPSLEKGLTVMDFVSRNACFRSKAPWKFQPLFLGEADLAGNSVLESGGCFQNPDKNGRAVHPCPPWPPGGLLLFASRPPDFPEALSFDLPH